MTPCQSEPGAQVPSEGIGRQDGPKIRELRVSRGLYRTQLAEMVGCHAKALQHIERQSRGASDVMIHRIAAALGVEPDDICKRKARAAA